MKTTDWPALGFGVGLRAEHYGDVLAGTARTDWFEAITENHLATKGRPLAILERVRRDVPVALHGVALSIGSTDPLDFEYLSRLRLLVERIEPALVTDHLCWTGVSGRPLYDLLPLPCTEEAVRHVVTRIRIVQDVLGRRIALENPSTYFSFRHSTIPEGEFLAAVAERADCGILLDVNNLYVSSQNLGFDPLSWLDALPPRRVAQIHLAGFSDMGSWLFDTHSAPVHVGVWRLYAEALRRFGAVSTLVEWDADVPPFERVAAEAERARIVSRNLHERRRRESSFPENAAGTVGCGDPRAAVA